MMHFPYVRIFIYHDYSHNEMRILYRKLHIAIIRNEMGISYGKEIWKERKWTWEYIVSQILIFLHVTLYPKPVKC